MKPLSNFDITRSNPHAPNASGKVNFAAVRGLALGAHATDATQLAVAGPKNFIGFLCRNVIAGGISDADRLYGGRESDTVVGPESPVAVGKYASVRQADEIEAEGSALVLTSGTGALSSATAIGQALSFEPNSGKIRIAQSGDVVFLTLSAVLVAAEDIFDTDSNSFRIRATRA